MLVPPVEMGSGIVPYWLDHSYGLFLLLLLLLAVILRLGTDYIYRMASWCCNGMFQTTRDLIPPSSDITK